MVNDHAWTGEDLWQKQREAEARVQRMREENRRLAQKAEACPPAPPPATAVCRHEDNGRWLPLVLALVILKEGGPTILVLALLYLAL